MFAAWLLKNSTFTNAITMVPDCTKYGRVLVIMTGAERIGHMQDAYIKDGEPMGVTLYQLNRKGFEELTNVDV